MIGARVTAPRQRQLEHLRRRIGYAHIGQHVEGGMVNALDVPVAQGFEGAPFQPGVHGGVRWAVLPRLSPG